MHVRMIRSTGLVFMLALGVAMSACSSTPAGSQAAAKVVPAMQAAAETATSVHVAGLVTQGRQTVTIDVSLAGNSIAGTLGAYGTSYYLLSLNGDSFVKLNAAFLQVEKAPASMCAKVCGKYVELPFGSAFAITGWLSLPQLVKDVFATKNMSDVAGSGCMFSPATVNGQSVLQCRQGESTLDVAAHGTPYLVYWSGPHGEHLAFSEWNSATLPPVPPASQVVSVGSLGA